jgi:glutamate---cysteine ligase / carboxylate-amine ligase
VRCLDAQTSLDDVAGLVALTHCLVVHEAVTEPTSSSPPPEVVAEASFRALRDGRSARLDLDGTQRPVAEIARQALQIAHAVARSLGGEDLLEHVERLLADGNGADRQRAAHATGGMPAVLRAVAIEPDSRGVPDLAEASLEPSGAPTT